jgi:hypothetical protein
MTYEQLVEFLRQRTPAHFLSTRIPSWSVSALRDYDVSRAALSGGGRHLYAKGHLSGLPARLGLTSKWDRSVVERLNIKSLSRHVTNPLRRAEVHVQWVRCCSGLFNASTHPQPPGSWSKATHRQTSRRRFVPGNCAGGPY